MFMYKIMALDVGNKRIGIAMSDLMRIIASPYENYQRKNIGEDIRHIGNIIKENNVQKLIAGLPVSMDGSENAQCQSVKSFCATLEKKLKMPVEYVDERFSTVSAERTLIEADVSRKDRKNLKDKLAAAIFLQSYLDKLNYNKGAQNSMENKDKKQEEFLGCGCGCGCGCNEEASCGCDEEDIVELVDDDGKVVKFIHVATIDYKDNWYVFFSPMEEVEGVTCDEVVIFRLDNDAEGGDVFTPIEDEKLLQEVYNEYLNMMDEEEEGEEGEEE